MATRREREKKMSHRETEKSAKQRKTIEWQAQNIEGIISTMTKRRTVLILLLDRDEQKNKYQNNEKQYRHTKNSKHNAKKGIEKQK